MCLRVFAILAALALANCASDKSDFDLVEAKAARQRQVEATEKADAERRANVQNNLIAPYDNCVRRSATEQLRINSDRNLAVENAFVACTTEEGRLRAYFRLTGAFPAVVDAAIFQRRAALKRSIVGP